MYGTSCSSRMASPPTFNGKLRDEPLDREMFYTLTEATVVIEQWRREYNTIRPHSALRYRPPALEAVTRVLVGGLNMSVAVSLQLERPQGAGHSRVFSLKTAAALFDVPSDPCPFASAYMHEAESRRTRPRVAVFSAARPAAYTSDRCSSVPVLSPKVSAGSPSFSSTVMCRFATGVSLSYRR